MTQKELEEIAIDFTQYTPIYKILCAVIGHKKIKLRDKIILKTEIHSEMRMLQDYFIFSPPDYNRNSKRMNYGKPEKDFTFKERENARIFCILMFNQIIDSNINPTEK